MTIGEFYRLLTLCRNGWRNHRGTIRRGFLEHTECPITAVVNKQMGEFRYTVAQVLSAAKELGLDRDVAREIIGAADRAYNSSTYHRGRILRALKPERIP